MSIKSGLLIEIEVAFNEPLMVFWSEKSYSLLLPVSFFSETVRFGILVSFNFSLVCVLMLSQE